MAMEYVLFRLVPLHGTSLPSTPWQFWTCKIHVSKNHDGKRFFLYNLTSIHLFQRLFRNQIIPSLMCQLANPMAAQKIQ
jgi:hypothetical protein